MKYLKKYNKINEGKIGLNSFSDESLKERLDYLNVELNDIQSEMATIRNILKDRKENLEENYSKNLPDSIFDFNKEQLDFIFEHNHSTTKKHYDISKRYLSQLTGVYDSGFDPKTNQFKFSIRSSSCFNLDEDDFELDMDVVKSIKFLGNSLKRIDGLSGGYVEFDLSYYYDDHYRNDKVRFINDSEIQYVRYNTKNFTNIEDLLKSIVENDLDARD